MAVYILTSDNLAMEFCILSGATVVDLIAWLAPLGFPSEPLLEVDKTKG